MQQRRLDKVKEARMWKRFVRTLSSQVAGGGNKERWLLSYQMPHVDAHSAPTRTSAEVPAYGSIKVKRTHRENSSTGDQTKLLSDYHDGVSDSDEESSQADHKEASSQETFDAYVPKSKKRIGIRATAYLLFGTAVVLLFADPMVKAISSLGDAINLSPFYISFVVTPVASNSSELFSAYAFAKKKTKKTISLVFSALYGAVAMNNTISLGVFLAMIFFRELKWNFSAETLVIAVVSLTVGLLSSLRSTVRTYHIIWVIAMYPLAIVLVALLESSYIGWD